jgi:aminopeptidase N
LLSSAQQKANRAIMAKQPDITAFQSSFNGPFPFSSDGVLIGTPDAGFEEEMQTMITFASGAIDLDTLYHENMHQWWGDNVTESNYDMTFFKEGMATLGEYLFAARTAGATGGPAAFQASLVKQFNANYARAGSFWRVAPSKPTAYTLFSGSSTYSRPGTAYIALRQILGAARFNRALRQIQRRYGGATINERQLEAAFAQQLPNRSEDCRERLGQFFHEWFDTAYPSASGATKPHITGPGLSGGGFYDKRGGCE